MEFLGQGRCDSSDKEGVIPWTREVRFLEHRRWDSPGKRDRIARTKEVGSSDKGGVIPRRREVGFFGQEKWDSLDKRGRTLRKRGVWLV